MQVEIGQGGRLTTAADALNFILAGNAVFTLVSRATSARYTYKVSRAVDRVGRPSATLFKEDTAGPVYFVSLLAGPDNTADYVYLGIIRDGAFRLTQKSKLTTASKPVQAFTWTLTRLLLSHLPLNVEVWHTGRCGRCARLLTVPESVARGIGPECAARMDGAA